MSRAAPSSSCRQSGGDGPDFSLGGRRYPRHRGKPRRHPALGSTAGASGAILRRLSPASSRRAQNLHVESVTRRKRRENVGIRRPLERRARDKGGISQRTVGHPGTLKARKRRADSTSPLPGEGTGVRRPPSGVPISGGRACARLHAPGRADARPRRVTQRFTPHERSDGGTSRSGQHLRVKTVKAITGGAPTLLRRLLSGRAARPRSTCSSPKSPRSGTMVRARPTRAHRARPVHEYLDPVDLATYLGPPSILDVRVERRLVEVEAHRGYAHVDGDPAAERPASRDPDGLGDCGAARRGDARAAPARWLVRTGLRKAARRAAAAGKLRSHRMRFVRGPAPATRAT